MRKVRDLCENRPKINGLFSRAFRTILSNDENHIVATELDGRRSMEEPWEALDADDSDLSTFRRPPKRRQTLIDPPISSSVLRPCSRRSSQPPSQHPGPQTLVCRSPRSTNSVSLPPLESSPRREEPKGERRIPGPAGAVQAAMQRRARSLSEGFPIAGGEEEEEDVTAIPTQEYIRRALEDGDEDGGDFMLDPWVCAVEFVRQQGIEVMVSSQRGFLTDQFEIMT